MPVSSEPTTLAPVIAADVLGAPARRGRSRPCRRRERRARCPSVRTAAISSRGSRPPASGVPVRPAKAGSRTSMSTVRYTGPAPTVSTVAGDDLVDALAADVLGGEVPDPHLGLPGEDVRVRPASAQADLHVAGGIDVAVGDQRAHHRPVVVGVAVDVDAGVGVGVEVDHPHRAVRLGAGASAGRVIEWSPPSMTGIAPAQTISPTTRLDRGPRRRRRRRGRRRRRRSRSASSARSGRPPVPTSGPIGRLATRIARGPSRLPTRSLASASKGAPKIATSMPSRSAGSSDQGSSAKLAKPGVRRLVLGILPAPGGIDHGLASIPRTAYA